MAVNVVRYEFRGRIQWGVIREGRITPIPGDFPTTNAFITGSSVSDLIRLKGDEVNLLSTMDMGQGPVEAPLVLKRAK